MFNFNVSAMGFGASEPWMSMVLDQLDDLVSWLRSHQDLSHIGHLEGHTSHTMLCCGGRKFRPSIEVMNVANTTRMKEECEKLALFLSKHQGPVVLSEVRPWHRNGSLFFFSPRTPLMFLSTYGC